MAAVLHSHACRFSPTKQDTGHKIEDTRHWTLNSGHETVDNGHKKADTRHWTLNNGHKTVDTGQ